MILKKKEFHNPIIHNKNTHLKFKLHESVLTIDLGRNEKYFDEAAAILKKWPPYDFSGGERALFFQLCLDNI